MFLQIGQKIDRYEVEALIGEGGMSRVYRVRERSSGTISALKLLAIPNDHVRRRMLKEGRIQSRIRHDNVVPVNEMLDIGGFVGLVMDHIDGPSLREVLELHQPSLTEALALFGGVLSGVEAAHERDLVHRDLKPANVLIQMSDDALVPMVCDFGIAKELNDPDVSDRRKTGTNATLGTPSYMAPEQIRNARHVDARADVWSLGVLLYELCTGTSAFPGNNVLEVMTAVSKAAYLPPEQANPTVPAGLCAVIRSAMSVDPSERVASASAMRAQLIEAGFELPDRLSRGADIEASVDRAISTRAPSPAASTPPGGPEVRMVATRFQTVPGPRDTATTLDDDRTPGTASPRPADRAVPTRVKASDLRPPVQVGTRTLEMAGVAGLAVIVTLLMLGAMAVLAQQQVKNNRQSQPTEEVTAPASPALAEPAE